MININGKEYNENELLERGRFLVEEVYKNENLLSLDEFKNLLSNNKGKCILPIGPGKGKTNAIQKFIVDNFNSPDYNCGTYATYKIEDCNKFYMDILSALYYKLGNVDSILNNNKLFLLTSDSIDDLTEDIVQLAQCSKWIITTHESLLINPSTILWYKKYRMNDQPFGELNYREYLFIDEFPNNVYKSVKLEELKNSLSFDLSIGIDLNSTTKEQRSLIRSDVISDYYNSSDKYNNPLLESSIKNMITTSKGSHELTLKRGMLNNRSKLYVERKIFVNDILIEKYYNLLDNDSNERKGNLKENVDTLYYTINDLKFRNMYIVDGTADILLNDQSDWYTINNINDKYLRKLYLKDKVTKLHTNINRYKNDSEEISSEYSDFINKIGKDNPDDKILVYTYKNSKVDFEELSAIIKNKLDLSVSSRVDIIHYLSGNETVTNRYSDHDIIVILGKFNIPNSEISMINKTINSNCTSNDYTITKLIQAVNRTGNRNGNSIKIYITDDYDDNFIVNMLSNFNSIFYLGDNITKNNIIDLIDNNIINSESSELVNKVNKDMLEMILSNCDGNGEIESLDLAKLLGYSSTTHGLKNKIMNKLNKNFIKYTYCDERGRGNKSTVKILK